VFIQSGAQTLNLPKVVSDSLGQVNAVVLPMDSILYLSDGQLKFSGINFEKILIPILLQYKHEIINNFNFDFLTN